MKFQRLRLRNFKCFEDAEVSLDRGVTVIHGLNGSGKSSLLEGTFFALYGTAALERTLEDVVTIGEDEAEVDLWFTHDGVDYHVERRIRVTGDRATQATCVLEGPETTYDGVRDVEDAITRMLRMDASAFVNSAFVRQGEINKLIEATPQSRQEMIDRLLQLGSLEEYRERAREARLGIESVLERLRGRLESIEEQIAEKEDRDLYAAQSRLRSELGSVEDDIERYEENREDARETLEEAREVLESYEEDREELAAVEERISTVREAIATAESEREDLATEIEDRRAAIEEVEDHIARLSEEIGLESPDASTVEDRVSDHRERRESLQEDLATVRETVTEQTQRAETLEERAADLEDRADEKRREADRLEDEAEEANESVAALEERLADLDESIAAARDEFVDAPVTIGEAAALRDEREAERSDLEDDRAELREDLASARSRVEDARELLSEGKCPECGQSVEGSPHVESLDRYEERVEDLESELSRVEDALEDASARVERAEDLLAAERRLDRLTDEREDVVAMLAERRETHEEKRERASDLRAEADSLEDDAEAASEAAGEARERVESARERIGEINERRGALKERIASLEDLREAIEAREEHESEIDRLQAERDSIAEQNDERRDHLEAARDRKRDLAESVDERRVEAAREDRDRARDYLDRVEDELADLRERRDSLQGQLGGIENAIEELESRREERERVAERVDALESLHAETTDLEDAYGTLRSELRQQNVARLERLLNETFELIYQNDSYARIELDGQYELTVYQKDGEPLDPDQLSGGERALFNLSLRTAIYRLLAEGIDGTAPMPPLILDEPTVFLDEGHVSRLVSLVESMRGLGVEQILVVSHDDELVGAAEEVLRVEKDATTNRSTVERVSGPTEAI
ncbi:MAG: DNA double-strand break repair ATPase Rad50 [Halanaeroarchaeum sp.]